MIQACLDTAAHVIAAGGFREPTDYGDVFRVLGENEVLSPGLTDRMVEMAGFRNVLAHEYAQIDGERVFDHLQNFDHFRQFAQEIAAFSGIANG